MHLMEKTDRRIEDLRNEINKIMRRIDQLEKIIQDTRGKNMEMQGKIATLAGRIDARRDIPRR